MVEVMKIMATSFKRSHAGTATVRTPTLQQATTNSGLCWRPLDTHRQVWVSLLWGHCSFPLGLGVHKVLFVPSKSLFTQSCVSSGGSIVGLMVTSSKSTYATPKSAAPRAPAPAAGHCWPAPPQETLKHSKAGLAQSLWGLLVLVHTRFCSSPLSFSEGMVFDSKWHFAPPTVLLWLLLCPWMWGIFFWWDPTFSCRWFQQ